MNAPRILALDFDGLLVDGLDECLLASWNGHHGNGLEDFGDHGLARIPAGFVKQFENHRAFARHLGHFRLALDEGAGCFDSQAAFDAAYAALEPREIERFVDRVTTYRSAVRQTWRERWLSCHRFYPGVTAVLKSAPSPIFIVTAKDSESVQELLRCVDVHLPDDRIFGECRDKVEALTRIGRFTGVAAADMHFFDDNVVNARSALQAGFGSHWALWGYRAEEHLAVADAAGLPAVTLEAFVARYTTAPASA